MKTNIETAKSLLESYDYSLVVVNNTHVEEVSYGRGILPLLSLYDKSPEKLKYASLADKIIGRAAALILAEAQIKEVYAEVLSRAALPILENYGIAYSYGELVSEIKNREGTDLCPMEKLCRDISEPMDGIMAITAFLCTQKRVSMN